MEHLDCCLCRKCGGKMKVTDVRTKVIGPSRTWKRRKTCLSCGDTYFTAEVPIEVALDVWEEEV